MRNISSGDTETRLRPVLVVENKSYIPIVLPLPNNRSYTIDPGERKAFENNPPGQMLEFASHRSLSCSIGGREVPKPPLGYIRWCSDHGPYCPECKSSQVWSWGWLGWLIGLKPKGCLHPKCLKYYPQLHVPKPLHMYSGVERAESGELPKGI